MLCAVHVSCEGDNNGLTNYKVKNKGSGDLLKTLASSRKAPNVKPPRGFQTT